ncbi:MAG: acetate/propionate family kinase [Candidatus Methylacidiphilales bacterium]
MPATGHILVANIGSTSFKFRLFRMPDETLLARGGVERIGSSDAPWSVRIGSEAETSGQDHFPDYQAAIRFVREKLESSGLVNVSELTAIGFKPVMARGVSGTQTLDDRVLAAMEEISSMLPAHNPPYIAAVRAFHQALPDIPCIGTFETAFYDHLEPATYRYPVPAAWEQQYGIRRYGFHGASHRYVSERAAQLSGKSDLKLVSCHLGGSSSLAAVRSGTAIDSSWGMTPQSGLPQNNRVGDFDVFAALHLARIMGIDELERALGTDSGLKGMAGTPTGDLRDVRAASQQGNDQARVALESFIEAIRNYLGRFILKLNGLDTLVFTAGIGENNPFIRSAVCRNLEFIGLELDESANQKALATEAVISSPASNVEVRVIPTNEEVIIARNAWNHLKN